MKQAWIKAASLYWLGCVINLRKGVVVVVVVVAGAVLSPPAAAEVGWLVGWLFTLWEPMGRLRRFGWAEVCLCSRA